MRALRGLFVGGASSGVITGVAGVADASDSDPALAVIIGVLLGAFIGGIIAVLTYINLFKTATPYALIGMIIGAFTFTLAANFDISLGNIVSNTESGLVSGLVIGGLVGFFVARAMGKRAE